jgi:hypothetical protein
MSDRLNEWLEFSDAVSEHIESYTVSQYGDKGQDQLTDYTADDCMLQVLKYVNRYGKNARPGQEDLDLLKIAHYTAVAWSKRREGA